jgi:hypothetical protein
MIIIIVILSIICIYLLFRVNRRITTKSYYAIKVKDLKNVPDWLKGYGTISLRRIEKTDVHNPSNVRFSYEVDVWHPVGEGEGDDDDDYH